MIEHEIVGHVPPVGVRLLTIRILGRLHGLCRSIRRQWRGRWRVASLGGVTGARKARRLGDPCDASGEVRARESIAADPTPVLDESHAGAL